MLPAGCGSASSSASDTVPVKGQPVAAPAFDRAVAGDKIVILCDPERFRLSIRAAADHASLDTTYKRRTVIDIATLVAVFPNHGGEEQYQRSLVRYERCGPLIVRLEGDFLNSNIEGEMGAIEPFAAITLTADNHWLYPELHPDQGRGSVRLTECDMDLPIWRDCPRDYAVRIDFSYVPAKDPYDHTADRLRIHEWVRSGDVLGAMKTSERRSSVNAQLGLWWTRRR
jgi:hypothetical protein